MKVGFTPGTPRRLEGAHRGACRRNGFGASGYLAGKLYSVTLDGFGVGPGEVKNRN
jgi:hypothetical protein